MTDKNKKGIGAVGMGSWFQVKHEFRDFFAEIQHNLKRIGDIGPESQKYKDHAFHQMAMEPDNYVAPPTYGTIGREDNKNLNRMEYDEVVRHDGKAHKDVMAGVNKLKPLSVAEILKKIKPDKDWDVNTTDTVVTDKPFIRKD